jgi:glycosyltransferase involved in cell wall biosynthesis
MRLLVVTTRYPTPDRPAAGTFVRDRLADPDLRMTVIAPRRYHGSRWARILGLGWEALTARGRFDGVEVHFVLPAGPIGWLAARLRRIPLVAVAHGSDVRDPGRMPTLRRWLAGRVVRAADAVVANSDETATDVERLGARATVVAPGIDLGRFVPSPRPAERRVLYLGGASAVKGEDVARRLAHTLVGPGIRELDPVEVPALMASHDVVLVPSRQEGFGRVAAEATAAGRWVVASAVGGLTGVVTDGVNGTLVRDGDFQRALAAVPDYDPAEVAASAVRFGRERTWTDMRRIWERVLAGRGRAPTAR